jgi:calcineurin-like phosphoesterase family protein
MSDFWFTSDHHFGHENIIDFCNRPYASVYEMNADLIERWNARVRPDDLVYYVGDIVMGPGRKESMKLIAQLNGRKLLLPGNHDACWRGKASGTKLSEARVDYLTSGFIDIIDTGGGEGQPTVMIAGETVKVSHFPYVQDDFERSREDRFSAFRPEDDGSWLIHGHIHTSWKVRERMINVSVDVWDYAPVNYDEIAAIITAGG